MPLERGGQQQEENRQQAGESSHVGLLRAPSFRARNVHQQIALADAVPFAHVDPGDRAVVGRVMAFSIFMLP